MQFSESQQSEQEQMLSQQKSSGTEQMKGKGLTT